LWLTHPTFFLFQTFVVWENLQQFLRSKGNLAKPQIFGHLLQDAYWGDQDKYFGISEQNRAFGDFFLQHIRNATSHVDYLAGGSGYIMNKVYLKTLIEALHSNLTLRGEVPEDMGQGALMLAHGVAPENSRDTLGREHFVPESPALWQIRHHARIREGSIPVNRNCCARYSTSFHHISPAEMHHLYHQFYTCRSPGLVV
jgi:hypothetical protein